VIDFRNVVSSAGQLAADLVFMSNFFGSRIMSEGYFEQDSLKEMSRRWAVLELCPTKHAETISRSLSMRNGAYDVTEAHSLDLQEFEKQTVTKQFRQNMKKHVQEKALALDVHLPSYTSSFQFRFTENWNKYRHGKTVYEMGLQIPVDVDAEVAEEESAVPPAGK
jgi:hypothetical protein